MGQEVDFIVYHEKASEFFWKGKYHPTNIKFQIELAEALRISRMFSTTEIVGPSFANSQYDPSLFRDKKIFGLIGDADSESGFGNCTTNIIKTSTEDGYDVRWIGRNSTKSIRELSTASSKDVPVGVAMIWHEQPKGTWEFTPFKKNIALIPFETTRIPATWVPRINKFDLLLCISKQNIQMMRDSGVTIAIELIHWGVDTRKFHPIERPPHPIFTFGTMGSLSTRKGTDVLVKAFQLAFPFPRYKDTDVRLICKTSSNYYSFGVKNDSRIKVEMLPWEHDELMRNFFAKVDMMVAPSRGEGWGLPPMEGMATGIPAIMTGWGGFMEFHDPKADLLLDYTMVPAKEFTESVYKENCESWAEPDLNDLVTKLRWSYENQDKVKEMGTYAAKNIQENWTWKKVMPMLYSALQKYL